VVNNASGGAHVIVVGFQIDGYSYGHDLSATVAETPEPGTWMAGIPLAVLLLARVRRS
jgi:hypothetical protein